VQVEIAVAKVPKYAVRESGDSVEVIERPRGGLSIVMADGQRSGQSAKAISNMTVRKAISLLAEGVRDGAVARASHDYLRTQRGGQVSAELIIISVDLETRTLVVSRNSRCPVLLADGAADLATASWRLLEESSEAVGVHVRARPVVTEWPLVAGQTLIAFTDGLVQAGFRRGNSLDPIQVAGRLSGQSGLLTAQALADGLLDAALLLDEGRPGDDVTIVVVQILGSQGSAAGPEIRRMTVSFPVPPV
jgi:serine phosphatase RsbU (regulator of sigma subunit)